MTKPSDKTATEIMRDRLIKQPEVVIVMIGGFSLMGTKVGNDLHDPLCIIVKNNASVVGFIELLGKTDVIHMVKIDFYYVQKDLKILNAYLEAVKKIKKGEFKQ